MTSQQIEYVLTLAEEKSFSKAAQRLFVTQPSLSQFIKNLEAQLNIQLFDRSTSPIRLTLAGEAYIRAARRIKGIEEELTMQLADLTNLQAGSLTIGTSPFRASCLLAKSIAFFHEKYPGVKINIIENNLSSLQDAILEGSIDLYLGTGPLDDSIFYKELLAKEQLYLAAPHNNRVNDQLADYQLSQHDIIHDTYKANKTKPIDLTLFEDEPFILQQHNHKLHSQALELCSQANFEPKVILYSERLETAFSWSLAGIGHTFIPDFLIRFGNYDKHPIYYKLNSPMATRDLFIAYKKNRYLSRAATEYIIVLKQLISHGTWQTSS